MNELESTCEEVWVRVATEVVATTAAEEELAAANDEAARDEGAAALDEEPAAALVELGVEAGVDDDVGELKGEDKAGGVVVDVDIDAGVGVALASVGLGEVAGAEVGVDESGATVVEPINQLISQHHC